MYIPVTLYAPPPLPTHTHPSHISPPLTAPTYDPIHIRIMPKNPIIPEDHPLQLTCASITLPARHLEFDLPEMPDYLESLIRPYHRAGMIVLRFMRVDRGHQGTYSCVAKDEEGRFTYNSVQLRVMDRGKSASHLPASLIPKLFHEWKQECIRTGD